jgi:pteridine reductase
MSDDVEATLAGKTALITGAAHRIGASIARVLHGQGVNVILHYRRSAERARALQAELQTLRPRSVVLAPGDLTDVPALAELVSQAYAAWKRLDVLVNNASSFYPTPWGTVTEAQWDELIGSNLKGPLFLSQAMARHIAEVRGCIVNIVDIHADRPLGNHPVYSIAKAGLVMMTKALARDLSPHVRVNAVAPGTILWPEREPSEEEKLAIVRRIPLGRRGEPRDIAQAVLYLIRDADYVTGQVLTVDGGRSIHD